MSDLRSVFENLHISYQPMVLQMCTGFVKGDKDLAADLRARGKPCHNRQTRPGRRPIADQGAQEPEHDGQDEDDRCSPAHQNAWPMLM